MQATLDRPSLLPFDPSSLCEQRFRDRVWIGEGSYGCVYSVVDTHNGNRRVAIKLLDLRGLSSKNRAIAWYTWRREVDMLSALRHPAIPCLFAAGNRGGCYYLVMELVEGETLEDVLYQSPFHRLTLGEVIPIGFWLCDVLEYLHGQAQPIIYGDLKPANIIRTTQGSHVLTDFGIARWDKLTDSYGISDNELEGFNLATLGSRGFAPPEQYPDIAEPSLSSDRFALGATLHRLLSGHHPRGNTPTIFDFPILTIPTNPPGSDEVIALVYALLDKDPQRRPSLDEIRRILQQAGELEKGSVSRPTPCKM